MTRRNAAIKSASIMSRFMEHMLVYEGNDRGGWKSYAGSLLS
jgi:hypothetical protein